MNIFICHTPLHLITAHIVKNLNPNNENLFIVIEDVKNIHALAKSILYDKHSKLLLLPGSSSYNKSHRVTQISNSKIILKNILSKTPENIFISHDQRIESQVLLNSKNTFSSKFVLLEDGINTYFVAAPAKAPLATFLNRKLRYSMKWKGSKWVGDHPKISEVWSFYPTQLRQQLKNKSLRTLPHCLSEELKYKFETFYKTPAFTEPVGVIATPHPNAGLSKKDIKNLVNAAIKMHTSRGLETVFKTHPRDTHDNSFICSITGEYRTLPSELPLELLAACEPIMSITSYRSSISHVLTALHPFIENFFFEPKNSHKDTKWQKFYTHIGAKQIY